MKVAYWMYHLRDADAGHPCGGRLVNAIQCGQQAEARARGGRCAKGRLWGAKEKKNRPNQLLGRQQFESLHHLHPRFMKQRCFRAVELLSVVGGGPILLRERLCSSTCYETGGPKGFVSNF
jgi:hypothetical protein